MNSINSIEEMKEALDIYTEAFSDIVKNYELPSDARNFRDAYKDLRIFYQKYKLVGREQPYALQMMYQTLEDPYKVPLENRKVLIVLLQADLYSLIDKDEVEITIPSIVDVLQPHAISIVRQHQNANGLFKTVRPITYSQATLPYFNAIGSHVICHRIIINGNGKELLGGLENVTGYSELDSNMIDVKYIGEFNELKEIRFKGFNAQRMNYFSGDFEDEDLWGHVNLSDINLKRISSTRGIEYYARADEKLDMQRVTLQGVRDMLEMYESYMPGSDSDSQLDLKAFSGCEIDGIVDAFGNMTKVTKMVNTEGIKFKPQGIKCARAFKNQTDLKELPEFVYRQKMCDPGQTFYGCTQINLQNSDIVQMSLSGDLCEQFCSCNMPNDLKLDFSVPDKSGMNRFKFVEDPKLGRLRVVEVGQLYHLFRHCNFRSAEISNILLLFNPYKYFGAHNPRNYIREYKIDLEGFFSECKNLKQVHFKNIKVVTKQLHIKQEVKTEISLENMFAHQSVEDVVLENIDLSDCDVNFDWIQRSANNLKRVTLINVIIGSVSKLDCQECMPDCDSGTIKSKMYNVKVLEGSKNTEASQLDRYLSGTMKRMIQFNLGLMQLCDDTLQEIPKAFKNISPSVSSSHKYLKDFYKYIKFAFEVLKFDFRIEQRYIKDKKLYAAYLILTQHRGIYSWEKTVAVSRVNDEQLIEEGKQDDLYILCDRLKDIYNSKGGVEQIRALSFRL